ncbi:prealbumin-like fold domain-containing protein [uncultured Clostridium sp.]|uniref:prealbumin-like fold domain-containing protein n=1 Tax=uncultured Clostridium sp. TaxID=59620 RepID=UPI0025D5E1D1|nr:prealbumin-like fold domain-containing protein [uncultured Clostridium sp.]
MNEDKQTVNKNCDLKVNLSAGDNKIKYYECNDDNCIFEILEHDSCMEIQKEDIQSEEMKNEDALCCNSEISDNKPPEENFNSGKIVVKAIIDYGKQEILKGVKINLYKINGLSPILIKSEVTDKSGEVVFSNIEEGAYRIIEIIDKEYFEKPKYINWNEITINCNNKKEKILVVNKLKKNIVKSKHN